MEFSEKLQELRKQKGITQEELADKLCVSRSAVSKWEIGRGYPSLDSLKDIAKFFSLSIDELLSSDELINVAKKDNKQKETRLKDIVFGMLDISFALLLFLPFFAENVDGKFLEVSLLALSGVAPYIKTSYYIVTFASILCGILTLSMQNCHILVWEKSKRLLSLIVNTVAVLLFIVTKVPYATVFIFVFLIIKALLLIKWN